VSQLYVPTMTSTALRLTFVQFDTTALRASLSNESHTAPIADWYTLHLTTVCSGSWTPGSENLTLAYTKEKENTTMTCTPQGVSWHFKLGSLIAGDKGPDSTLSTIDGKLSANMAAPVGLLVAGAIVGFIALLGLFATSFKHGFGPSTHMVCVASVVAEFMSAILVLAGVATLTATRARLTSSKNTPEAVQSFTSSSFMMLLWVAAIVPFIAGAIGIIGQHKEKRMHALGPKAPPIKVPSVSSDSSSRSSPTMPQPQPARSRGASDVTVVSNGRIRAGSNASYGATRHTRANSLAPSNAPRHSRSPSSVGGGRARADSQGVASLRLGHISSNSTASTNTTATRNSGLPPTSGSIGARRYGV
jgi:hypothetical protein